MSEDLGKVHAQVKFFDSIPGVIRDEGKVRKNYSWAVSLNVGGDGSQPNFSSYNLMRLNVIGNDGQALAACTLPKMLYEPVDNYIFDSTNTSDSATSDIYWKEVGNEQTNNNKTNDKKNDEDQVSAFSKVRAPYFSNIVKGLDSDVENENYQFWSSQVESVSPSKYSEDEYDQQSIKYKGDGYQTRQSFSSSSSSSSSSELSSCSSSRSDLNVEETENSYWVRQFESAPGVWWGIENKFPFKEKGWPFWVTIRPSSINLKKGKSKGALMSIMIGDDMTNSSSQVSSNRDRVGFVELIIDNLGNTFIAYQIKANQSNSNKNSRTSGSGSRDSGSDGSSQSKDGNTESGNNTALSTIPINMPHLSEAFANGQEMRIGFIQVMGRLCIITDESRYQVVNLMGSNNQFIQYNLDTPNISVFGYGCTASVSAFPMTFVRRGWMVMPDMDPNISAGFRYPSSDVGSVRAGSLSDGRMISKPTTLSQQQAGSTSNSNSRGRMYGGTFYQYREILQDANAAEGQLRETSSALNITQSNPSAGMLNPWGRIHFVRSAPIDTISNKKFWFMYMETQRMSAKDYTPSGDAVTDNDDSQTTSRRGHIGYPTMFSMMAYKPMDRENNPSTNSSRTLDITDDLVSLQFTAQLDSPRPTSIETTGSIRVFNTSGNYNDYLAKARGIKVWLKWGVDSSVTFSDDDIVFSGIAFGRQTVQAPGEEYVDFECKDHWTVLDSMQIKNSPFYDGFHIGSVVEDVANRGGIEFSDDVDPSEATLGGPGFYFLGQGTVYDKPLYRFSSDRSLKDCVMETIKNYEVYVYFDTDGKLHMAPVPGGFLFNKTHSTWDPDVKETYYLFIDAADEYYQFIIDGLDMVSTLSSTIYNSVFVMSADRSTGGLIVSSRGNRRSLTSPDDIGYLGFVREARIQRPDLGNKAAVEWWSDIVMQMYSKPGFEVDFNTAGHVPSYRCGQFIRLQRDSGSSSSSSSSSSSNSSSSSSSSNSSSSSSSSNSSSSSSSSNSSSSSSSSLEDRKFRVTKVGHNYDASNNMWKTSIGAYQVEPASASFNPSQDIPTGDPDGGESS